MRSTLRAEIVPTGLPSGAVGLGARVSRPASGSRAQHTYRPKSLTLIACLVAAPFLSSCATNPAVRVTTSVNSYEWERARYDETCPGQPACAAKKAALAKWSKYLDEAGLALKRGGELPKQLAGLKAVEREYPK